MLPFLTFPSYRLASYSGMPSPTRAPVTPPTAPPTAAPLSAAMMGPAAMNGPTPGMANAPIPASQPSAPPKTPPVTPPVVAPSGALVCCSCAKSLVPPLSGSSTEISLLEKLSAFNCSTISMAWDSDLAIQSTDVFDMMFYLFFCLFEFNCPHPLRGRACRIRGVVHADRFADKPLFQSFH